MVKFIIEVSEGYIKERADIENILSICNNPAKSMFDLIAFSTIEKDLEINENPEYIIKSTDFADDSNALKLFNDGVSLIVGSFCDKIMNKTISKKENSI